MLSRHLRDGLSWFCLGSVCLFVLATPVHAQRSAGTWTGIGPLPIPVSGYTLTVLQDGEILITGGQSGTGVANSAFLYNATTHSFRSTSHPMKLARMSHAATLLPDGTVLITGGWTPNSSSAAIVCSNPPLPPYSFIVVTSCAELYDPDTQAFTLVGSMNDARVLHTATFVDQTLTWPQPVVNPPPMERVVVAGGLNGNGQALDSLEYYDLSTQKFVRNPQKLQKARYRHTATWLPSVEKILIAGGTQSTTGGPLDTAEIYDSAFDGIRGLPQMTSPRLGHTATLLKDGTVLLAGGGDSTGLTAGNTAETFDPASQTFAGAPGKMAFPMLNHAAALMSDGAVLLAGGEGSNPSGLQPSVTTNAQIFNPHNGLFFAVPPMLSGRKNFSLGTTPASNKVLAAGGSQYVSGLSESSTSAAEIFVPSEPRQLRPIALAYCLTHLIACQLVFHSSPLILSGIVHHAMVVTHFPGPPEEPVHGKAQIAYRIIISGLADSWDAAVVTEDGLPLKAEQSSSRETLILTMVFKDAKAFEAARDNSLLVFQMTSKAVPGKEYPITIKTELASRPSSDLRSHKP